MIERFRFDRTQWSKSTPMHVPSIHKDTAPAYIEVGSGSFQVRSKGTTRLFRFISIQDAPSLSVYGSSLDSLKSDFEVELMEKLADAAVDISLRNSMFNPSFILPSIFSLGGTVDTTDSLTSSTCSSTVTRPVQNHHSLENMMPFPDTGDPTD